jgi:hypothetical protein
MTNQNIETEGQLIKLAMGEQWKNLSAKTQTRFENEPSPSTPKKYTGVMSEVKCSKLGKLMTYFTNLIHAPLIPYHGKNVPIEVTVCKNADTGDIHKERIYYFDGKKPFQVHSNMRMSKGQFQEFVNSWLGMNMRVYAKEGNLHFEGTNYFIKLGNIEIPLPAFLSPGKAYIKHADDGEDGFLVKIEMIHPWFGLMFLQEGIFKEKHG